MNGSFGRLERRPGGESTRGLKEWWECTRGHESEVLPVRVCVWLSGESVSRRLGWVPN